MTASMTKLPWTSRAGRRARGPRPGRTAASAGRGGERAELGLDQEHAGGERGRGGERAELELDQEHAGGERGAAASAPSSSREFGRGGERAELESRVRPRRRAPAPRTANLVLELGLNSAARSPAPRCSPPTWCLSSAAAAIATHEPHPVAVNISRVMRSVPTD